MPGPLAGVRVIEASAVVSGPYAAMLLADQGADVIKVEARGTGDITRDLLFASGGLAALFTNCNRGKRSIALDLKNPAGRDVLLDLVREADVFIENFRPGKLEGRGLGYADLAAVRPELIHVSITGYGPSGPYADRPVYDPVIQGLTGHVAVQCNPEIPFPDLVRTIVCDKATGLTAAQAVSTALFARERGAGGQHIDVPMLDAALAFFWPDGMVAHTMLAEEATGWPYYQVIRLTRTADGHLVYFVLGDIEWRRLFRALGRPEWAEEPAFATRKARAANLEKLGLALAAEFERWPTAEIIERLVAEDVAAAPVLSLEEVLDDPQVRHNQLVGVRRHPSAGDIREVRPAARFAGTPADLAPLAPLLGEHTDEILAELGYDAGRISGLRATGVVGE